MGRLFINKLIFTGTKGISTIQFGERLTLITGPSDTGKSYIYKSIYYLLGAKTANTPFSPSIGYDTISMELKNGDNIIVVTRELNSSKIIVTENDTKTKYSITGKMNITNFYLNLLKIPEGLKVPKNETGQTQAFSLRTMKSLFMVREEDTETSDSILLPNSNTGETAFLSGLLYFLYKRDFSEYDPEDGKRTIAAKKAAVAKYISSNIEKLNDDKLILEKQVIDSHLQKDNVTSLIFTLEEELNKTNNYITELLNNSRPLNEEILKLETTLREKKLLVNRYRELETQYVSDIERLGFIIDGEKIIHNHESLSICPFCNNEMPITEKETYLEASKAEVKKILVNSSDLSQTIGELEKDLIDLNQKLNELRTQKNELEEFIKSKLNPQKISLNDKILKYTAHIQATEKLEFINNTLSSMDGDLNNLDETIKTTTLYKPKSLFESHFVNDIARNYMDILKDVNFKPLDSVSFDLKTFDIVVNNEAKKEHGKGYRALLNSVLILSLRKYINDNAHINPKFYLIDSPLHGLAMPHNAEDTENVRKGFFNYLINNYNDDQMIIIENILPDELPNNIKDDPKIKLIAFTQDENSGIYGLLNNVTKK